MKKLVYMVGWLGWFVSAAQAQTTDPVSYSLHDCVQYALQNNQSVKNAVLDSRIAQEKVAQTKSGGLPQVNADLEYIHNIKVQNVILENGVVPAFTSPDLPIGDVLAFPLQLKNQFLPSISANQLLFDQSFFTGLQASKTYQELAQKTIDRTRIDVAESVTKAYYGVLVSTRQMAFLDVSLARADSLFRQSQARLRSGLARQIDVDRIEVTLNNLKQEREKSLRVVELNKALLAFQMNLPVNTTMALTDTLNEQVLTEAALLPAASVEYTNRVEYGLLQTRGKLNDLNIKNVKAGYYPRLAAFGTFGYNPAATQFGNIFQSNRWLNYGFVGLKLQVPIFDGFNKRHEVQQLRLEEEKHHNSTERLEREIDLEVRQAQINLANSLESLRIQKRNLNLAQENVRVLKAENERGITLNIEVTNAETALKESQNNYYNALYNAFISKVDAEKAAGTLLNE